MMKSMLHWRKIADPKMAMSLWIRWARLFFQSTSMLTIRLSRMPQQSMAG